MWLTRNQTPTYKTINHFRVKPHMMEFLHILFVDLRAQILKGKIITEDVIYIDGIKIEANVNKYTFQRLANTNRFSQSVIEKSTALYEQLVSEDFVLEIKCESENELINEKLNQLETYLRHKNEEFTSEIETYKDVGIYPMSAYAVTHK